MRAAGRFLAAAALAAGLACDDAAERPTTAPDVPAPTAGFELSGRILGASDDDADMELTLRETRGVAADVNFARVTCSNRAVTEWGASSFVAERGTNRIEGSSTLVFVRHYRCPASGRPSRILVDVTDVNGHHVTVESAPYHPDWPGA